MDFNVMERKRQGLINAGFKDGQATALIKLENFYNDKTRNTITLCGEAGTGKTYIMKYFLDNIVRRNVCVTAPTHKAVRNIEKMVNRNGKTLQSLHGLRPNVNLESFNIDNVKFDTLGDANIKNYDLVIIDECSQINSELYQLNKQRAEQFKVKVIFVGDFLQLPPVKERISRCFTDSEIIELTEIARQEEGNPLIELLRILRTDITAQSSTFLSHLATNRQMINEKGQGYMVLNKNEFCKKVSTVFNDDEFTKDLDFVRLTAWKNDTIRSWNKYIRDNILNNPTEVVTIDDLFTGYKTIVDDYYKPILVNSDDYIVESIERRFSDGGFDVFLTGLKTVGSISRTIVNIVDHKSDTFINYYKRLNDLHFNACHARPAEKKKKWREYYTFKDNYLSLITFDLMDRGEPARGKVVKDIDYGFGLTAHKAQGSTYTNVFVDLHDMLHAVNKSGQEYMVRNSANNPYAIEMRNKLIYVSLSRASKMAYILI